MTHLTLYSPFYSPRLAPSPFSAFERLFRSLDEEIDGDFSRFADGFRVTAEEDADAFRLTAALPGLGKDNVTVNVTENILSIEADFSAHCCRGDSSERADCKAQRDFRLSKQVDAAGIGAEMKNGVLTLRLPKRVKDETAAKRAVEVK